MPITWRNIDAPDFSGAANIMQAGSNNIQNALNTLGGMAQQQVDKDTAANTASLMEGIRQNVTDTNSYNAFDLNQAAQQYGGYVDQRSALDMLLGMGQGFAQQDQAVAQNAANVQAANIKAGQQQQADMFNKQVNLLERQNKTTKDAAQLLYDEKAKEHKFDKIDEGLVGDPKIGSEADLYNKWRNAMKDIDNPNTGNFFGGKGGAGTFVNDFNQELTSQIDKASKALGTRVSPQFVDYAISLLDRNEDGAVKLSDLSKVLKDNYKRYTDNEAKRKLRADLQNQLNTAKINEDNRLNQNIAKLLGR